MHVVQNTIKERPSTFISVTPVRAVMIMSGLLKATCCRRGPRLMPMSNPAAWKTARRLNMSVEGGVHRKGGQKWYKLCVTYGVPSPKLGESF